MAALKALEGLLCVPHGATIHVNGMYAKCDSPTDRCSTEVLRKYAASLNGHIAGVADGEPTTTSVNGKNAGFESPPPAPTTTYRCPKGHIFTRVVRGIGDSQCHCPTCNEPCVAEDIIPTKARAPEVGISEAQAALQASGLQTGRYDGNGNGSHSGGQGYSRVDRALMRVPPQNLEAEQSVLGAVLLVNSAIEEANRIVAVDDFYREAHREIFGAMQRLWRDRAPIDAVTMTEELRRKNVLEAAGGPAYIAELAMAVPTAQNIVHYAAIVKSKAISRDVAAKATEIASLAYDGVSAEALLGEAARLLNPVVESNGGHLPQLIDRDIEVITGLEFFERNNLKVRREWLVEGFLARKEISLWSGKVEAGKTTLMRTLVMALVRGEFFLDRHTYPTKILYVMLDADGEDLTFEEFRKLGWNPHTDEIDFLIDPVMALRPNSFEQFHQKLLELKPGFVVIDPLGRFQKIADFLGYETTYAMAQFSELAKRTNCHIGLLHHIPRGRSDTDDVATAGFGSIAIAGGCNARFVCGKKTGGIYTLNTSKGKGGGFTPFDAEKTLQMDPDTHWITLGGTYDWKEQATAIEEQVYQVISQASEPVGSLEIGRAVQVQRSIAGAAAKNLANNGRVEMATTKSGKHLFAVKGQMKLTNQRLI